MGRIGPVGIWELLIILVVILLIFGPRRLPEMAKGIGQSVREFRRGLKDVQSEFEAGDKPAAKTAAAAKTSQATAVETGTESTEAKEA